MGGGGADLSCRKEGSVRLYCLDVCIADVQCNIRLSYTSYSLFAIPFLCKFRTSTNARCPRTRENQKGHRDTHHRSNAAKPKSSNPVSTQAPCADVLCTSSHSLRSCSHPIVQILHLPCTKQSQANRAIVLSHHRRGIGHDLPSAKCVWRVLHLYRLLSLSRSTGGPWLSSRTRYSCCDLRLRRLASKRALLSCLRSSSGSRRGRRRLHFRSKSEPSVGRDRRAK